MFKKLPKCMLGCIGEPLMLNMVVPSLYKRNASVVTDGGDPAGLPVSKAMYKIKGTAQAMFDVMSGPKVNELIENQPTELLERLGAMDVPILIRVYRQDADIDVEKTAQAATAIKKRNPRTVTEVRIGVHYTFWNDDFISELSSFAGEVH
jgi:hypothetical protein